MRWIRRYWIAPRYEKAVKAFIKDSSIGVRIK